MVNVGDNVYFGGFSTPATFNDWHTNRRGKFPDLQPNRSTWLARQGPVSDPTLDEVLNGSFRRVYLTNPHDPTGALGRAPFLSSLGNHDYGGSGCLADWQTQIEMSRLERQWVLPYQYFRQRLHARDFFVDVFMSEVNFDSASDDNGICAQKMCFTCNPPPGKRACLKKCQTTCNRGLRGAREACFVRMQRTLAANLQWLRRELRTSKKARGPAELRGIPAPHPTPPPPTVGWLALADRGGALRFRHDRRQIQGVDARGGCAALHRGAYARAGVHVRGPPKRHGHQHIAHRCGRWYSERGTRRPNGYLWILYVAILAGHSARANHLRQWHTRARCSHSALLTHIGVLSNTCCTQSRCCVTRGTAAPQRSPPTAAHCVTSEGCPCNARYPLPDTPLWPIWATVGGWYFGGLHWPRMPLSGRAASFIVPW